MADIQRQIAVADELAASDKLDEAKDIWRAQIIYAEGILDFYIHELSKYALVKMFLGEWEKSKPYDAFQKDYVKGQDRLKMLYARRNQIAHQADRKHSTAEKEDIDREFVQEALGTVKCFVDAVHRCAVGKQREMV